MLKRLRIILVLIGFLCSISASAQITIAEDWSQSDCAGTEHNLYNTLDTGSVVVMEIVMLDGCMPCINTAHLIGPVIDAYNALYENRIQYYTFGYNDTYSCEALIEWKTTNEITCNAQFVEGADIASYYGGMGMPTIVVIGRNIHHVYFNEFGFVPSDTIEFALAIEYALGLLEPAAINSIAESSLTIAPNPVHNQLYVSTLAENTNIAVYDVFGKCVIAAKLSNSSIDVSSLQTGIYTVRAQTNNLTTTGRFVKS